MSGAPAAARRVAFVVPYGQASESFLPDTLLSWLSARARRGGHTTSVLRVYYDGRDATKDDEVRRRLLETLDELAPTDVVVERVFDLAPLLEIRRRHGSRLVMVCRGDGFDPDPRLDGWIGRAPGLSRGRTRRTPTIGSIVRELDAWLEGRADELLGASDANALPEVELDLDHRLVGLGDLEPLRTPRLRTLFGNSGCPYAADPRKTAFYAGLPLSAEPSPDASRDAVSLLGCAFCPMGGDYERAAPEPLVRWVAAQARAVRAAAPSTEGFVLSDQAPLSYLEALLEETRDLAPARWLVAMRADALLRETSRLERAIARAHLHGHRVSLYLTGFESFSDRELERYVKGTTAAELVASVERMRALARTHPASFEHAEDRGHSLILWSPWTSLDDLDASLETIRRRGLRELFADLGRNELRLTHELPITQAAARDGALLDAWPQGRGGAARGKGYATERPWRFLDGETALAHAIAQALRESLGRETELAQLCAASHFARGRGQDSSAFHVDACTAALARLTAALDRWLSGPRGETDPRRGRFLRALVVDPGTSCRCGRASCAERDAFVEPTRAMERLERALATGPGAIVLAGGDVAAHPDLDRLAARVREAGLPLGIALPAPSVPSVACDALCLDVTDEGDVVEHAERLGAAAPSSPAPRAAREVRVLLTSALVREGAAPRALVQRIAASLAPDVLRVVTPLDAVGLDALDDAVRALESIARACRESDLAFEASPLTAAVTWRERMVQAIGPRRDR